MSGSSMNLLAFAFLPIVLLLLAGPYILLYDYYSFHQGLKTFTSYLIIILPVGIILHELIHGITWAIFAKKGFKSISFGINWKALAAYCHCNEPLKVKHYSIGGAMPGILTGIAPAIIALISGSAWLLVTAAFFTWAASGDIMILWMLRHIKSHTYVYDHPEKLGFYAVTDENEAL